ncbi:MAG: ribonuclease HI [Candidatus Pacebacteria bacterium]|nr:ribonuclease HI [Candidatus Paceibacterota bacterium]
MITKMDNALIAFTDGSSLGNPGPGGWGALLAFPKLDELVELGGTKLKTTNNEMELTAIVSALSYAINSSSHLYIFTDSQYAINGVTKWMYGWALNGWKTKEGNDIKNKELFQSLYSLIGDRGKDTISWHHVRGHVGVPGNERVDDIARLLAEGTNVKLYRGKISEYPEKNILTVPSKEEQVREAKKSSKKSGKAYKYLALIDGELEEFDTWAECEARTTGRKSKFKKALSPEHREEILKDWGVNE